MEFLNLINNNQSEGFKKHIPIIEIMKNHTLSTENIIKVEVGKEIKHPNLLEHSIRWISLYVTTKDNKIIYIGKQEFEPSICNPIAKYQLNSEFLNDIRMITAISYCNLHGLWKFNLKI